MRGFVYLLLNPAFPNMVKIGKTTKDPEVRVKELSRATGVPTPFKLIYQIFVSNCDVVEKEIHFELQNKGLRNTTNREFFNIEPFNAIELFKEYEERFRVSDDSEYQDIEQDEIENKYLMTYTFEQRNGTKCDGAKILMDNYRSGAYDSIQNFIFLKKAYNFGCLEAGIEMALNYDYQDMMSEVEKFNHILDVVDKIASIEDSGEDKQIIQDMILHNKSYVIELLSEAIFINNLEGRFDASRHLLGIIFNEFRSIFEIEICLYTFIFNHNETNEIINKPYFIKEHLKNLLNLSEDLNIHDIDTLPLDTSNSVKRWYTFYERLSDSVYMLLQFFFSNDHVYYEFMLENEEPNFKYRLTQSFRNYCQFLVEKNIFIDMTSTIEKINECDFYLETLQFS